MLVTKCKQKTENLGVVGLDGRMILKCILKRMGGEEAE
jgi:hypothetical protein